MTNLREIRTEAKTLRKELESLNSRITLSHGEGLNLVSRMKGAADWNTFFAKHYRRYFYDRHEPYLPNRLSLVCALSVRKAALADATNVEITTQKSTDGCHYQFIYGEAIARAFRQAEQTLAGEVNASASLLRALKQARTRSVSQLRGDEALAEQEVEAALTIRERKTFDAALHMADSQAEAYSAAYIKWRLTTLSVALAQYERRTEKSFIEMSKESGDLFDYVGRIVCLPNEVPSDTEFSYDKSRYARSKGKAVLFSMQASGSMEPSLQYDMGLNLDADDARTCAWKVNNRFPEFSFWHAWAELKDLLAVGVDKVVA